METEDTHANQLFGKTCLVTGATSGIGAITARELARQGAKVIVVSRSPQRCAATAEQIQAATGNPAVEWLAANLSSQAQIRQLADEVKKKYDRLDVLVNNAGGFFMSRQESVDGIELTFALNHLSYFLLTLLLLDLLKASAPARIVSVSSDAHRGAKIDFDDLQEKRHYSGWRAYGQSKLGNVLFTYELARRLSGTQVTANALHPGFVATGFAKNNGRLYGIAMGLIGRFALTPEAGARTSIYLASSPEVEGISGCYFSKERPVRSSPVSYDRAVQECLWQASAEMVGI